METMAKQDYGVLRVVNYVCIQDVHIQTNLTVVCCKLALKIIGYRLTVVIIKIMELELEDVLGHLGIVLMEN